MRAVCLCLLICFACLAQTVPPDKGVTRIEAADDPSNGREDRVALVVGINRYDSVSGFPSLKWAQNDAAEMSTALQRLGYIVQTIPQEKATAAEILRAIGEQGKLLTPVRGGDKQGTFLFYFSGHGTSASATNYLITANTSRERLTREALGMDEVQKKLAETPARRKILLVDACRTVAESDGTRSVSQPDRFAAFEAAEGERILLAAPFGEPSREYDELKHGAFTYFLLKTLRSPSLITFRQLADSVSMETRQWTHAKNATQVPKELGEATLDFAIGGGLNTETSAAALFLLNQGRAALLKKSYVDALSSFAEAAADRSAEAMYQMGLIYREGQGVPRDYARAKAWFTRAADAGNAPAMRTIGQLYANGQGAPQDFKEAALWYGRAADLGDAGAMTDLSALYRQGKGVTQDVKAALTWSRKAADRGDVFGMNQVGMLLWQKGPVQDFKGAMTWFEKSAGGGYRPAMLNVGMLYLSGEGVPRDPEKAVTWLEKAANAGLITAMEYLGTLYQNGRVGPADPDKALTWYRKAADGGSAEGMCRVASSYESGKGVSQDRAQAVTWYQKAAAAGNKEATAALKRLGVEQ